MSFCFVFDRVYIEEFREKTKAVSVDEGMQRTAERWGILQGPAENARSVGMVEATYRELTEVLRLQGQSH